MTSTTREPETRCLPLPGAARIAALALLVVAGVPAKGELAVFVEGDFLRIEAYQLVGERMKLHLPEGGWLTVPLARIERIIDDEIVATPVIELEEAVVAPFELGFDDQSVPQSPFGELIHETARRHALNPYLLSAMMRAESAYDVYALSNKGARGLLQLMPATAERFGVSATVLYDPAQNLEAAARYLVFLRKEFEGELPLILAAYNAGEGAVRRHGGIPPYRETQNYVARIYRFLGLDGDSETAQ